MSGFRSGEPGLPFARVYQPALHYAVAALATSHRPQRGTQLPHPDCSYVLAGRGGVLSSGARLRRRPPRRFQLIARVFRLLPVRASRRTGPPRQLDGRLYGRRLQALVYYGEGPNVTGLMLAMLALAALHFAMQKRTALSGLIAAFRHCAGSRHKLARNHGPCDGHCGLFPCPELRRDEIESCSVHRDRFRGMGAGIALRIAFDHADHPDRASCDPGSTNSRQPALDHPGACIRGDDRRARDPAVLRTLPLGLRFAALWTVPRRRHRAAQLLLLPAPDLQPGTISSRHGDRARSDRPASPPRIFAFRATGTASLRPW